MSAPIEDQLRDYFTMVDLLQGPVDADVVLRSSAAPALRFFDTDHDQEDTMLTPNKFDRPTGSRRWLAAAAAVAVLALIGGLIAVASRGSDGEPADRPDVSTPPTTVVDEETAPPPDVEPSLIGAATGGSVIFPDTGNGGYVVSVYDWDLALSEDLAALSGTATITATATQDLRQFSLDARELNVASVSVDSTPVEFALLDSKLVITTDETLQAGDEFAVAVRYDAEPGESQPAGTRFRGWEIVPGEQLSFIGINGSWSTWTPYDEDNTAPRARYVLRLDAPDDFVVTAGGTPGTDDSSTVVWDTGIATPFPTFAVADFDVDVVDWDVPVEVSIAGENVDRAQVEAQAIAALTFLESLYGPFPFERLGVSIMDTQRELRWTTPTRVVFAGPPSESELVQQLSWQWAGLAVGNADELDEWLFAGLAVYAEALWAESLSDDVDAAATGDRLAARVPTVTRPLDAAESFDDLVDPEASDRAALLYHALRLEIGDDAFFTMLGEFIQGNLHGDVVADDLRTAAEAASGQDLGPFFDAWISDPEVPDVPDVEES